MLAVGGGPAGSRMALGHPGTCQGPAWIQGSSTGSTNSFSAARGGQRLPRQRHRCGKCREHCAEGQTRGPRCSCSSCNRCSKAEQELQQLVLTVLPKHVATPGPEFWGMALRGLEELVKQGSLSWCCSANDQSEEQRGASACESSDSPVLQPQSPCLL